MKDYLLAIDQGTTNSRAIIFNRAGQLLSQHEIILNQSYPHDGWIEQNPLEMIDNTILCCQQAMKNINLSANDIAAVGISNQRETTIIWDKQTGQPIYPAIVWQDRRTSEFCNQFSQKKICADIQLKTGLLIDPYFSASKIVWILDNIAHAHERAERGELLFGTVDTFLIWTLTKGKSHVTDASNASRTLLFNIHTQTWDKDILTSFNIPTNLLPTVLDNAAHFGDIDACFLGASLPITGVAGDQQAATMGQVCFEEGMVKATYGTGCFMLLNTGNTVVQSRNQLVSTVAYRLHDKVTYGLEGSIFSAGTTIKWLRDTLKIIDSTHELEPLASGLDDNGSVYLVPAFTGLGAPYWDPDARGAILGLTRNSSRAHIVRAALESVAYQSRDLLEAMTSDCRSPMTTLRVDGGMAANDWLLQFIADILDVEVQRPFCIETSALGAAYLAGLYIGMYRSLDDIAHLWKVQKQFSPNMAAAQRNALYKGWKKAVNRVL